MSSQAQANPSSTRGYSPWFILITAVFITCLVTANITAVKGEFANSFVLAKMKIVTSGRWLWTRTIGSTLVGQGLDSLVFITRLLQ